MEKEYFTLAEIKKSKELKKVEGGLEEYTEKANSMVITNTDNYGAAADFCKNIKQANRAIEQKRKFFVDPYNLVVKNINSLFKGKTKALGGLEMTIKSKMIAFNNEQERLARLEREKIEKANAKKQERFEKKVEENPDKNIKAPIMKEAEIIPQKTNRTMDTTSTVRKITKWKIYDIDRIPKEYLVVSVDEKKVNALVKAGVEIPGIEIYQESSLSIR